MGLITQILTTLFGAGRNAPLELIAALRGNVAEATERGANFDEAALAQFAAEFKNPRTGWFDRFVDALNRLPRPLITLGVLYLLLLPVIDLTMAVSVFTAWSVIPPAVWAIIAVVITFFFGGRQQATELAFNRDLAAAAVALPRVVEQLREIRQIDFDTPQVASTSTDAATTVEAVQPDPNPALAAWRGEAAS